MDHPPLADLKFESALSELEALIENMEEGQFELEASIGAYQRGMQLIKHCQGLLADAEQQIQVFEKGRLEEVDRDKLMGN